MGKSKFKPGEKVHVEFDAVITEDANGGDYTVQADQIATDRGRVLVYQASITSLEKPLTVKALPPFTVFRADVPSWPGTPFVKLRGGAVHLFKFPAFLDLGEPSAPVTWKNKDYSNIEILFQLPEDEDA